MNTPPRVVKSLVAPYAPARETSSNTTELTSISRMQELPENQVSTPPRIHVEMKCPNAPSRKIPEFQELLKDWVEMNKLTLDFSNINTTLSNEECFTPPPRMNKRRRVSFIEPL